MKSSRLTILLAALLILFAASWRVAGQSMQLWNIAPVAAIGLFSGSVLKDKRLAFLFPLLAQLLADLFFELFTTWPGFYGVSQLFTYGGMAAVTALGIAMRNRKPLTILGFAVAGSAVFFLLSNFGMWVQQFATPPAARLYTTDLQGLINTFVMAVPFYKGTLIGDVVFGAVLFGGYALAQNRTAAARNEVAWR